MILSAAVMAHPDRAAEVDVLLDRLDPDNRLDRQALVHWDTEGKASGSGDRIWRQARAAWQMADPAADWHVVIQDDAVPCADLLAGLCDALEHVPPDAVVSPYLGTGRNVPIRWEALAKAADHAGAAWVRSEKLMWGVTIVMPVPLIAEMIAFSDRLAGVPDDMRVAGWVERRKGEVWYTWPSLVDHLPVPSLTKHRAPDRVARRHHPGSALDLVWSGPVITDPVMARRRAVRSGPSRLRSARTDRRSGKVGNGA